jgi:hypothetical protein
MDWRMLRGGRIWALPLMCLCILACGGGGSVVNAPTTSGPSAPPPTPPPAEILPIVPMKVVVLDKPVELLSDGTVTIGGEPSLLFVGAEVRDIQNKTLFVVEADGSFTGPITTGKTHPKVLDDGIVGEDGTKALSLSADGVATQYLNGKVIGTYYISGLTPQTRRTAQMLVTSAVVAIRLKYHREHDNKDGTTPK